VHGDPAPDKGYFYRSDQFSFARVGVPGIYVRGGPSFVGRGRSRLITVPPPHARDDPSTRGRTALERRPRGVRMAKAELKTKASGADVTNFLAKVTDEDRRKDCERLVALMTKATGAPAKMWGSAIVGFGDKVLTYPNGRELDWFVCGMSPRKGALTLYGLTTTATTTLLEKLGKHASGKGCLYVKKLSDIDEGVLRELVALAAGETKPKRGKPKQKPPARS
jgi:Domain of unknown function (DU1801)